MTPSTMMNAPTTGRPGSRQLSRIAGLVILQIVMTVCLITFLAPTFWMISSSLKASTEVFQHPIV